MSWTIEDTQQVLSMFWASENSSSNRESSSASQQLVSYPLGHVPASSTRPQPVVPPSQQQSFGYPLTTSLSKPRFPFPLQAPRTNFPVQKNNYTMGQSYSYRSMVDNYHGDRSYDDRHYRNRDDCSRGEIISHDYNHRSHSDRQYYDDSSHSNVHDSDHSARSHSDKYPSDHEDRSHSDRYHEDHSHSDRHSRDRENRSHSDRYHKDREDRSKDRQYRESRSQNNQHRSEHQFRGGDANRKKFNPMRGNKRKFNGNNRQQKNFQPREKNLLWDQQKYLDGTARIRRNYHGVGYDCEICGVSTNCIEALQDHFWGATHQKMQATTGLSEELDRIQAITDASQGENKGTDGKTQAKTSLSLSANTSQHQFQNKASEQKASNTDSHAGNKTPHPFSLAAFLSNLNSEFSACSD